MDQDINYRISSNLKKIRKDRSLSLENLAQMSGVSKSMLAQIERQESNPTVNTLWKIALALNISFTSLIEGEDEEIKIVKNSEITPLVEDEKRFILYPVFPYDNQSKFEVLFIEIEKDGISYSQAHDNETYEYIVVYQGKMAVKLNNEEYVLSAGESIKYQANVNHSYQNVGDEQVKLCMIIYYQ